MLDLGTRHNVPVAALVGTRDHALAQVRSGVDILVVAGGEAGGPCREVASLVLVQEGAAALDELGEPTPYLPAGGLVPGPQIAAALPLRLEESGVGNERVL